LNPIRLTPEKSSYRTEPPSTSVAEWSWQDCQHGLAAGGASEIESAVFGFRWHGAGRRSFIYGYLMAEAVKAEKRHRWSERLYGRRYLDPMVQLALDVEQNPRLDGLMPLVVPSENGYKRLPGWWCLRLPWLTEAQWRKEGELRYSLIRQPLDIWAGEAMRKCRPFLRDDD
jgi:hypothetical protein